MRWWVPKTDLEHMVRFTPYTVAEAEGVEDLQRAALQTVCLAVEYLILRYQYASVGSEKRAERVRKPGVILGQWRICCLITHLRSSLVHNPCPDTPSTHPICHLRFRQYLDRYSLELSHCERHMSRNTHSRPTRVRMRLTISPAGPAPTMSTSI